jgi:putative flippase GtrA
MNIFKFTLFTNLYSDQKIKYLLVGSYNTMFGYLVFVSLFYNFSLTINYSLLLAISHVVSVTNNFFLYRAIVFKVKEKIFRNYLRFHLVYSYIYMINLILLALLVNVMNWNIYLSQGLIIIITTILSYFLNKNYSFSIKNNK